MITPIELIETITTDIALLDVSDKKLPLKAALFGAIFKAMTECNTTSRLTREPDAFFEANKLYVAVLDVYKHLLMEALVDYVAIDDADNKQFIIDQSAIFIALISKILHPARSAKTVSDISNVLPGKMWVTHIKPVYDKEVPA